MPTQVDGVFAQMEQNESNSGAKCNLIFAILRILLLRAHADVRARRLGRVGLSRTKPSNPSATQLLQPVIDLLQYEVFCERVQAELEKVVRALQQAGITTKYRFKPVCENGDELVALLWSEKTGPISGEALLRIDDRHTLRFALQSPSSLIAHLPQATLTLASIPQLSQLLRDEVIVCLLNRICEVGQDQCDRASGTWFVDLLTGRSVGRWEGCVLNFQVQLGEDHSVVCIASRLAHPRSDIAIWTETYSATDQGCPQLLHWVRTVIGNILSAR